MTRPAQVYGCFYRDGDEMSLRREEMHETKRAHMAKVVKALLDKGWTAAQLGAYIGVTPVTANAWKTGRSMGTNAQREQLQAIDNAGSDVWWSIIKIRLEELDLIITQETKKFVASGLDPSVHRFASERMVHAQKWRETLQERLENK